MPRFLGERSSAGRCRDSSGVCRTALAAGMHVNAGVSRPLNTASTPQERSHRQPRRSIALLLLFLSNEPDRAVGWVHTASVPGLFSRGSSLSTAAASHAHEDPARRALLRVLRTQGAQSAAGTPSACFAGGAGLDQTADAVEGNTETVSQGKAQDLTSGAARAAVPNNRVVHERKERDGPRTSKNGRKAVERDHVRDKIKHLGRQRMWEEALERLATEGKGDSPPVRALQIV